MWFTSDNAGPAAPEMLAAIAAANEGYGMPYGADDISARVTAKVREVFEHQEAVVHLAATGTAANSLALATLCPPWASIIAHRNAHIEEDECGGPEFFTGGAKITLVDGDHARMTPEALEAAYAHAARAGVHNVQRGPLSITNATEAGAIYDPAQVSELSDVAKRYGQRVHMDGTRFANAVARLGCAPADLSWKAGVDILCLGATKNGAMAAEAVILFDPELAWEFELRRKRGGHLFSKMRYVAAQIDAYLTDGLWLDLATRANASADRLVEGLAGANAARVLHPVEANMVFAEWPREGHRRAQAEGARYYFWPFDQSLEGPGEEPLSARLVNNWATTAEDVDRLVAAIRGG